MISAKVFKYELKNLARSRWVAIWSCLLFLVAISFIKISGDFAKALLAFFSILSVAIPLVAMLFSSVYWYYSDRFTQLLLTLPLQRRDFFWARWLALVFALSLSLALGLFPPFIWYGGLSAGVFLAFGYSVFLILVFVSLGMWTAVYCADRMKGIGIILGLWLYFVIIHDGLLLVALVALKDYPLDTASALAAALNPIGLVRVSLILHFDAPLLLSQTGAMVRQLVTSTEATVVAVAIAVAWIVIPATLAERRFKRSDF